jgi:methyl-accepting chemotaxis protein
LFLLTFVTVLVVVLMVTAMYARSSKVLGDIADIDGISRVENEAYALDLYFRGLRNIGENAAPGVIALFDAEGNPPDEGMRILMESLYRANSANDMIDFYIGVENTGKIVSGNGWMPDDDYDSRTRPWYRDAVTAKKTIITEPYVDTETKSLVVSTGTPICDASGKLLGVLAGDISLAALSKRIAGSNVMGVGSGALIAPGGTVLEYPNRDYIMKENIAKPSGNIPPELAAAGIGMLSGQKGWSDFTARGDRQRIFYAPSESGYVTGIVVSHSQIGGIVSRITLLLAAAGLLALILLISFMFFLIPSIVRPLRMVEKSLGRIAGLDLTLDPETERFESEVSAGTETGAMVASLQNLRRSFNEVIRNVRLSVERMTSSSEALDELANGAMSAASSAKTAIGNVEKLSKDALGEVGTTVSSIQEVTRASGISASSATEGAQASSAASKLSSDVFGAVSEFVTELRGIGDEMLKNSESMASVETAVVSISGFVATIGSIASQTNLLALNAAIEAARAGDAGRGFAVVAGEVHNLAAESNAASQRVVELIEKLEAGTSSAIKSTQDATDRISGIVSKAEESRKNLEDTLGQTGRVNEAVQSIAAAAQEQAASSNEISESASRIHESISDLTDELSTVSRTSVETASIVENVAQASKTLSDIASDLEGIMSGFKIEEN